MCCKWIKESNRMYHVYVGFVAALFGTIVGAIEVGVSMEVKDCHHDAANAGKKPWEWTWRCFDWRDFAATIIGGIMGQLVQLLLVWLIFLKR